MDTQEVLILAMVGLPARGKSYISKKLARFLNWTGLKSKVFNIGMYRRVISSECEAKYFDQTNKDAVRAREQFANMAMNDLIKFFEGKINF